jgi:GABA(A) receptor-associated protein
MWKYLFGNTPVPSKLGYEFKMENSYDKRKQESSRLKDKFPDKVAIILEKGNSSLPNIDKTKFLMQQNITVGQFLYIIRDKLNLDSTKPIFLLVNNSSVPNTSETIGQIYNNYMDKDGFLYITYSF